MVFVLSGCALRQELRVATDGNNSTPTHITQNPTTPLALPLPLPITLTPTQQTIGHFSVQPIIVQTLPANLETPPPGDLSPSGEETPVFNFASNGVTSSVGDIPLAELSIEALAQRAYGQDAGTLTFESTLENTGGFTRSLFSYPSDGLKIYGFMNTPLGSGPFPVVIFVHGYVNPLLYETLDYSVRYADDLTRRGFIVIHPNLRGYPPSDEGMDYFEIGKAIDVLNLVALIQRDAGKTDLLAQADPNKIALWGHSMGGGIALRVVTVNLPSITGTGPAVKAAILYAPMSGDEAKNAYHNYYVFTQPRWEQEITIPPEMLLPISPVYHYEKIEAAIQIHHGAKDSLIPIEWSRETCAQMQTVGITLECYEYRTQTHNFCCDSYKWMLNRMVSFLFIHMP